LPSERRWFLRTAVEAEKDVDGSGKLNKEHVLRSKLRVESRQWYLERSHHWHWGPKSSVAATVETSVAQMSVEQPEALIDRMMRRLELIARPAIEKRKRLQQPIFIADRLQAVKWRNWKMHFCRQDTMIDPPVRNPVPMLFNLYTDPREETPALDSWVVGSMLNIVGEFQESVKTHPLIPMGTPDPYTPP
jgi:hypothetical protein